MSERRRQLLAAIDAAGVRVTYLFGAYGRERDAAIARAKVVLNIHNYATQIFEIVRVSYLLNNGKAVVAEVNPETAVDPAYADGFCGVPAEAIAAACRRLVDDAAARRDLAARGLATLRRLPQAELLAPLLAPS